MIDCQRRELREAADEMLQLMDRLWKEVNWNESAISAGTFAMLNCTPARLLAALKDENDGD